MGSTLWDRVIVLRKKTLGDFPWRFEDAGNTVEDFSKINQFHEACTTRTGLVFTLEPSTLQNIWFENVS